MRPVCVKCRQFFSVKRNGFHFTEGMPIGERWEPYWVPYKVWAGDLYECRGCGAEIVSGFGAKPISVRHEADFQKTRNALGADKLQVNDC